MKTSEVVLICKTVRRLASAIRSLVKKFHSYDYPWLVTIPIDGEDREFLNWITRNVS